LTPNAAVERYAIEKGSYGVVKVEGDVITLQVDDKKPFLEAGMVCLVQQTDAEGELQQIAQLEIQEVTEAKGKKQATARVRSRVDGAEIKSGDLAITPTAANAATGLSKQTAAVRVASGFGSTCTKIGILIAMASIIGKCLLDSGAADRIVRSALARLGEKGAPFAFLSSGFALGVPVFFDTVFYLMIPLGKAMRMRTGRNYLLYVLTIVAGATMAHSLVPPTPGPLFVAEQLGVDIGVMILAGCVVGFFTAGFGYIYAHFASRMWELPLRESADLSLDDLGKISKREDKDLPPLWLALLPIVLPVILIAGNTVLKRVMENPPPIAATLGDKNVALIISAAVAMAMLVWQKRTKLSELGEATQSALAGGGVIILITAAGGAFGGVLQQTGVAGLIGDLPESSPLMIVAMAFLITAAIRTAQGSATVAMITSVGILSGIATAEQLGFHPVYLALAIGCGSKPIGWMNDSGFWVITKMSGMTEGEGLKYVTPMTSLMGVVGLIVVMIGVTLFPMV
jgi:GntP family gluconate:H+ symporter